MDSRPEPPSTVPATEARPVSHFNPRPFPFLLVLVGTPGSGKSRFAGLLIADAALRYERVCQDVASARGTPGTRKQCLAQVRRHLLSGASVVLDRCNMSVEQRAEFLALARACNVQSHVLVFELPVALVVQRAVNRVNHEGGVQGPRAAGIIRHQMKMREPPAAAESFQRVTVCRTDAHVDQALAFYRALCPSAFAAASGGGAAEGPGLVGLQGAGGGRLEVQGMQQRQGEEELDARVREMQLGHWRRGEDAQAQGQGAEGAEGAGQGGREGPGRLWWQGRAERERGAGLVDGRGEGLVDAHGERLINGRGEGCADGRGTEGGEWRHVQAHWNLEGSYGLRQDRCEQVAPAANEGAEKNEGRQRGGEGGGKDDEHDQQRGERRDHWKVDGNKGEEKDDEQDEEEQQPPQPPPQQQQQQQQAQQQEAAGRWVLAFPSISTADFKFDRERAAAVVLDCVTEFLWRNGAAATAAPLPGVRARAEWVARVVGIVRMVRVVRVMWWEEGEKGADLKGGLQVESEAPGSPAGAAVR
ncbi:unnamed protein product [Closterium sp. Naga37s-1]|nr:unnamed protein product [Closterium sp. Naga37s-1]